MLCTFWVMSMGVAPLIVLTVPFLWPFRDLKGQLHTDNLTRSQKLAGLP